MISLLLAISLAQAAAAEFPLGKAVDLSHPYDEKTIYWPTESGFALEKRFAGMTDQGYYYAANALSTPEHGGTHIDAPIHFHQGGRSVDEIPVDQLIGKAVVVDASASCARNPDYQLSRKDLESWEKLHGKIPEGAILLLRTGFGKYWPDRKRYLGTEERGAAAVARLRFPGLEPAAAKWLVEKRSVKAVGIDTASIDYGQSKLFETHRALFARNVPAFENLANLELLPATGATVFALPMKIKGGSGGPLRIAAILAPRWVVEGTRFEGDTVHAVGAGTGRVDALADALGELAASMEDFVSRVTRETESATGADPAQRAESDRIALIFRNFSKHGFGNITVKRLIKDYARLPGTAKPDPRPGDVESSLTKTVKVEMKAGKRSFTVKVLQESQTLGPSAPEDLNSRVEITGENLQLRDLLDELRRVGIRVRTHEDDDASYVGLTYEPPKGR